jgi:hypothetical protein
MSSYNIKPVRGKIMGKEYAKTAVLWNVDP